jgi:outer membrane protein OmpU
MKHVLLATTALAMTASFAAADVSLSGRAGAGSISGDTAGLGVAAHAGVGDGMALGVTSEIWSGIDLNVSASVTTDSGVTVTVADDFGGGKLPDYADKELDWQESDLDTPAVSVAFGGTTVTFDNQAIDDRYDNSQNGDIAIDTTVGGATIGITFDTDAAADNATTSYAIGYTMGDITLSVIGTDADDANNSAMVWSASWAMNSDITLSLESDNMGAGDDVTTGTVAYTMGALALSLSADDNDDWNASATYTAGALSVTYATDEESAWEADVSYAMGSGVALKASSDSTNTSIIGIDFTF